VSSAGAEGRPVRATGSGEVSVHGGGEATLVDLLDRVIGSGVVVHGDIVLGVAGVDLVHVGLRLVLRGVDEPGGVR
jgi:hypothetical protein